VCVLGFFRINRPYRSVGQIRQTVTAFWCSTETANGVIDDGTELFGNLTPQPPSTNPNGYLALAVFDLPQNGGNNNGAIDPGDAVFDRLRIWIDANHDGISEPNELHKLTDVGVYRIDLTYHLNAYVDQYGNQFRYRAKIWDEAGDDHNTCYDVFLKTAK